jgi:hypothetical protein
MSASSNRLLKPEHLPIELWNPEFAEAGRTEMGLVRLPLSLSDAYVRLIDRLGLRSRADARDPDNPPVGGLSLEQTHTHFAQAFDGSCARVQLALMDPFNRATKASNNLVRSLSGNRVVLADAPSGAGAAAFSLLATIAQLRSQGVLPRVPLDVHLVAGEIAEPARQLASQVMDELRPSLEEQAITLSAELHPWNVTDALSNTDFVARINVASDGRDKRLLVVANFNGFLVRESKQTEAKPQLTELVRHCSGVNSYAVWIEPDMNRATGPGGLFQWIRTLASTVWSKFAREEVEEDATDPTPICCSRFELPLNPPSTARVGLSLMPLDLTRRP